MSWIVLNCDCGEGADDAAILRWMSAANIACGGHAGDANTMRATLRLCRALNLSAGAHPSFPDRDHFGRRVLPLSPAEVRAHVTAQIGALVEIAHSEGVPLTHVKPHGALYNHAAIHRDYADAIAEAVLAAGQTFALVGPPGSALSLAAQQRGLPYLAEGFADRRYRPDGSLVPRDQPAAMIEDAAHSVAQALSIVRDGLVRAEDGSAVLLRAQTLCLHSDAPGAATRAQALRQALDANGIAVLRVAEALQRLGLTERPQQAAHT